MNGSNLSKEFLYQALALIVSIILVHENYVSLIRPEAKAIIAEQQMMIEQDINYVPDRSFYVIVRDLSRRRVLFLCFGLLQSWQLKRMPQSMKGVCSEKT